MERPWHHSYDAPAVGHMRTKWDWSEAFLIRDILCSSWAIRDVS